MSRVSATPVSHLRPVSEVKIAVSQETKTYSDKETSGGLLQKFKATDKMPSVHSVEQKSDVVLDAKGLEIRTALLKGNTKPFREIKHLQDLQEAIIESINFSTMKAVDKLSVIEIQTRILEALVGGNYWKLHLSGCKALTNDRLLSIIKTCPNLSSLDISDCSELSATPIRELARNCPKLERLFMSGLIKIVYLSQIGFDLMVSLTSRSPNGPLFFPKLQHLNLENCTQLTLIDLNMPQLCHLALDGCSFLSTIELDAPRLKHLSVENCKGLEWYWSSTIAPVVNNLPIRAYGTCVSGSKGIKALSNFLKYNTHMSSIDL